MIRYCFLYFSIVSCFYVRAQTFYIEKDSLSFCEIYKDSLNFKIRECFSLTDSVLISIDSYLNDKKTGIRNIYYKNGVLKSHEIYLNDRIVGSYMQFFEDGKLHIMGNFSTGEKIDSLKEYCDGIYHSSSIDNSISVVCCYCFSSPRQGKWTFYADNGKKYCEGYYKNNIRVDEWLFYNIYNGKIEGRIHYENGVERK